jgi:hypothetical protein
MRIKDVNQSVQGKVISPRASTMIALAIAVAFTSAAVADDEALITTPPGFTQPGEAKTGSGATAARLRITVRDQATGRPTPCRLNVVGPDGHFYQPAPNPLTPFSLTGQWPKTGKGNRKDTAPYRYLGRFFYTTGEIEVAVPAGNVHVEAWRGFEYRPEAQSVAAPVDTTVAVDLVLDRTLAMEPLGYHSGDLHLHFPRKTEADDRVILDLLEAEDIQFGTILAYNEPEGPYEGTMETMAAPQLRSLGKGSVVRRGEISIASGQEYRGDTYGHLNLLWRDDLVLAGQKVDANNWPLYGTLGRETQRQGGFAIHAHGGYAQSIYADFVRKNVDAVELLQFGVYRGIELADWYHILNIGYRFPCVAGSDYPACRKLGDCLTYVYTRDRPDFAAWLEAVELGRSFVTSGPMLLLDVDGEQPGGIIHKNGTGPHRTHARVRAASEVALIQAVQIIVNGKVVHEQSVPAGQGRGTWITIERPLELERSSWITARAFSKAPSGAADAEAHTNPVYVYLNNKAPYDRDSLDRLVSRIDEQIAAHRKRRFDEKARVLDDFQRSRDILMRIRRDGGLLASGIPNTWLDDEAAVFDASRRTHSDPQLGRFLQSIPALTPDEALKVTSASTPRLVPSSSSPATTSLAILSMTGETGSPATSRIRSRSRSCRTASWRATRFWWFRVP